MTNITTQCRKCLHDTPVLMPKTKRAAASVRRTRGKKLSQPNGQNQLVSAPSLDGYEELFTTPVGENVISFDEDGSVTLEKRPPEERSSIWKGAKRIAALPDSAIKEMGTRPRSGIVDYVIDGCSVSYRGVKWGEKRAYLCHTHVVNRCGHTERVRRWREEHGG